MKLSVALCTYNGEQFIKVQLESILNQSLAIDEIIICDDGSSDRTIAIIEEIKLKFPNKISLYKNEVNLGLHKNFEKAIKICSGDYIFLSDQDDIWRNDKAEKIINYFSENESLEGVFSNANLINENGESFTQNSLWNSVFFIEESLPKPIDLFSLIRYNKNMVTGATLCFKKEIKSLILPIPTIHRFYHDEWIAIHIASRKSLGYLTDELISYRIHSKQQMGVSGHQKTNRLKTQLKLSNFALNNTLPKSYQDFNQLTTINYKNYLKFKKVADHLIEDSHLNFKKITVTNLELLKKHNHSLKKINPVFYFFRNIIDRKKSKLK